MCDFIQKLNQLSDYAGRIAAWLFIPLVLITILVTLLRYGFNIGHIAMQETISYIHAAIIALGIAYTWQSNRHVRVDIFYNQRSERQQLWLNLIGNLLLLSPVCLGILIISWDYVRVAWLNLEGSAEAGGLPLVFILKSLIPTMAALLFIQAIADTLDKIQRLRKP